MGEHNVKNRQAWSTLSANEKEVSTPQSFYALAGFPNPLLSTEANNQENHFLKEKPGGVSSVPVPKVHKLTLEEYSLYRPLYECLANLQKIANELGKQEAGQLVAKVQRKSAGAIEMSSHGKFTFKSHDFFASYTYGMPQRP